MLPDSSKGVNHIHLSDTFLKDLIHRSSGEYIQNGKQVVISPVGMHINVLNIQAEVFHWVACL